MSNSKNTNKISDSRLELQKTNDNDIKGELSYIPNDRNNYAVTVSKKLSPPGEDTQCTVQKSFISIHSTDHLCQVDTTNTANLDECNVEVLSVKDVFPSTSEESVSNDESPVRRKRNVKKKPPKVDNIQKSSYMPLNSKSCTISGSQEEAMEAQTSVHSELNALPKNTLYVTGSNPGEPKMSYQDPPKKMSKTMKKFLRNIDKHKHDHINKSTGNVISKLTTMRGILKDGRCVPECTGDSSLQDIDDYNTAGDLPYAMSIEPQMSYTKQASDKNVSFNTQVVIVHFTGDLCVGQSIETLSKEKDQQARNSELRRTFLTKYFAYTKIIFFSWLL